MTEIVRLGANVQLPRDRFEKKADVIQLLFVTEWQLPTRTPKVCLSNRFRGIT